MEEKLAPWWLWLIAGIASILVGILLFVSPVSGALAVVWVIGFWWIVNGIADIVSVFGDHRWWGLRILGGIIGILAGSFLMSAPLWGGLILAGTLVIVVGIMAIVTGVIYVVRSFQGEGWGAAVAGLVAIVLGIFVLNHQMEFIVIQPWVWGTIAILGGIADITAAIMTRQIQKGDAGTPAMA